jgi:hypothetical protein
MPQSRDANFKLGHYHLFLARLDHGRLVNWRLPHSILLPIAEPIAPVLSRFLLETGSQEIPMFMRLLRRFYVTEPIAPILRDTQSSFSAAMFFHPLPRLLPTLLPLYTPQSVLTVQPVQSSAFPNHSPVSCEPIGVEQPIHRLHNRLK